MLGCRIPSEDLLALRPTGLSHFADGISKSDADICRLQYPRNHLRQVRRSRRLTLRERGRRHGRLQHGYSDDWQRSSETRNEETLTRLALGCHDRVCVRRTAITDKIASAGVLVMLPVLAFTFLVRNYLVSGLMAGGVKE